MRLDLRDVMKTPGGRLFREIDEAFSGLEGIELVSSVTGSVTVQNSRQHIVVDGKVTACVALECSRCMMPVELPVYAILEAVCAVRQFESGSVTRMAPEDEDAAAIFDETSVLVDELVRQALILQLPLQVLCKPDCRGLCAECGANLNVEACRCPAKAPDPRLTILHKLLHRMPSNS